MHKETYTAKNILDLYLELKGMHSDQDTWTEDKLVDDPPRFYRLKKLLSLFRAFDLGDIREFDEGTFVVKRNIEDYRPLIKQIKSELKAITKFRKGEEITLNEISFLFERLLDYRWRWDRVINFSSGLLACSAKYRYAYYKVGEVNGQIHDNISPINDILTFIMSPSGKVMNKKELLTHFNYPHVDLSEIDEVYMVP